MRRLQPCLDVLVPGVARIPFARVDRVNIVRLPFTIRKTEPL